jgi:hypothetical protein
MLIWIGVVGTVLCLIGMVVAYLIYSAVSAWQLSMVDLHTIKESFWNLGKQYGTAFDKSRDGMEAVFAEAAKKIEIQNERFISDFKQATANVTKSQDNLADSLGALLREIKISKQLAQGMGALGEQTLTAIDKLWKLIELIRSGPRAAANIAPNDEQIAAAERGESPEQEAAIQAMLAGARARLNEQSE